MMERQAPTASARRVFGRAARPSSVGCASRHLLIVYCTPRPPTTSRYRSSIPRGVIPRRSRQDADREAKRARASDLRPMCALIPCQRIPFRIRWTRLSLRAPVQSKPNLLLRASGCDVRVPPACTSGLTRMARLEGGLPFWTARGLSDQDFKFPLRFDIKKAIFQPGLYAQRRDSSNASPNLRAGLCPRRKKTMRSPRTPILRR